MLGSDKSPRQASSALGPPAAGSVGVSASPNLGLSVGGGGGGGGGARSEREEELRRLAAQRLSGPRAASGAQTRAQAQSQPPTQTQAQTQDRVASAPLRACESSACEPEGPSKQAKPKNQRLQPQQVSCQANQQNSKQLAIYINGKIRSNSIFCRSSSSSSFSSILNRFHASANSSGQHESHLRVAGDSKSPLRVGGGGGGGRKGSQAKSGEPPSGCPPLVEGSAFLLGRRRLVSSLRSGARKLVHGYLRSARSGAGREQRGESVAGRPSDAPTKLKKVSEEEEEEAAAAAAAASRVEPKLVLEQADERKLQSAGSDEANSEQSQAEATKSSYKLNPSSMFLRKAMRYYRLWIYCANITILLGTLIFVLATLYVASDYRIRLLVSSDFRARNRLGAIGGSGEESERGDEGEEEEESEEAKSEIRISYTESGVILAYVAIAIQAGVLQAIGCFGAIRMKERWIQTFWYLILALTLFDVVFLLYWLSRYDFIIRSLRYHMSSRLSKHYGRFGNSSMSGPEFSPHGANGRVPSGINNSKLDKTFTVSICARTP